MKKKAIAFISAFILILSTTIPAFAEVDKKAVTTAWFKYVWETDGGNQSYERKTGNVVPVSENPFAATTYARIEQTVEKLTEEDYRKILFDINSESSLEDLNSTFWGYWDGHDIDIGLTLLYDNGLERYDDGDYQKDGVWLVSESSNELYNDEKYRHIKFIDNGDSFTMVTEQGNEELGTYKKVYGFDTDADIGYSGGSAGGGGSTGGSTGTSNSAANTTTNSNNDTTTTVNPNKTSSTSSASNTSKDVAVTAGRTSSVATGSNPPVTPEVVSAVDAAKSAKEAENSSESVSNEPVPVTVSEPQKSETNILGIIVVILVIGVIAYLIIQKKKGDNNGKINSD